MERYAKMLSALGSEARLAIFRWLVRAGPQGGCVEDIQRQVRIAPSTLSHHLDALRRSGLLSSRREGRFIYYMVEWADVGALLSFLTEDCCAGQSKKKTAKKKTAGGAKK
jgi:ArsR family transcriptional regulator, arsenate/arsenite/antimonite-responsive transcriptional repressor